MPIKCCKTNSRCGPACAAAATLVREMLETEDWCEVMCATNSFTALASAFSHPSWLSHMFLEGASSSLPPKRPFILLFGLRSRRSWGCARHCTCVFHCKHSECLCAAAEFIDARRLYLPPMPYNWLLGRWGFWQRGCTTTDCFCCILPPLTEASFLSQHTESYSHLLIAQCMFSDSYVAYLQRA